MINNNKILTVSYGIFSCTLEGFDGSFGTMKAIAEYFRDLSADDRYFGAEPAQPDAQMLARIAEREISRHVEAREDKGRIVLSAQSAPQETALVTKDAIKDADEASADVNAPVAPADEIVSQEAVETAPAEAAAPVEPVTQDTVPEVEAKAPEAKLKVPRPRVVVQQIEKTPAVADEAPKAKAAAAPEAATESKTEAKAAPEEVAEADPAVRDIVPSLPDEEVEAFFADRTSASTTDDEAHEDIAEDIIAPQERAKADSIADKLKRIRAVVSQQGEATAEPDYSEDQHADATVAPAAKITDTIADDEATAQEGESSDAVLANTLRDLEDALDADDQAEEAYDDEGESDESEDDDIAAILNRLESEADTAEVEDDDFEDEHDFADDFEDEFDDDFDDEMGGNILAAMDTVEAVADDTELTDENLFEQPDEAAEAKVEAPAPATPTPARVAPRTRVLKVKRATLEAAIQSGQLEEYDEDDEEDQAPDASLRKAPLAEGSSLSGEAEDALARELAELKADMEAGTDEDYDFEDEIEAEAPVDAPRARVHPSAGAELSRLMEESEQQMDEPEAATRRDAFAHLRAAVAAKKADGAVGGIDPDAETDEAYHDDLASVVRPRRPASGERTRTERPPEARPAPLKLVAEQRIDTDQAARVTPVRPRRVAAVTPQDEAPQVPQAEGFADFAEEMGATKLPDLLEAAAAYLSFVEGHAQFSHPQLMTKVRQVEKENFTREDSLRSFGKLLREGKIEKMTGGRFQASDQIGFKPAKRAAG